ncbi:MAG TPA: S-methyl-5-thioribose-1-phosphate isomerase [Gemmatimonadaceae bacterium]|nr:S-methyl-5-thioribose-1-phosphate isomerase [Gemmatimonadaceae bacterium]
MPAIQSVRWSPDARGVRIIDQRLLPNEFIERDLTTLGEVCGAIQTLSVRGAPAIGICGAMGLCVVMTDQAKLSRDEFLAHARSAAHSIASTRPTAVNLSWALERVLRRGERTEGESAVVLRAMRDEATAILEEDRAMCQRIGEAGASLIDNGARVLTHCNAGALATGGIGTALAPVYVAASEGRNVCVLATETRPLLQGSRLTAWELTRAGIPVTVITDSAAAARMRAGEVDLCIVGADRVVANGDVANKVGTYSLAVVAHHHRIPFYVAMPSSTIDPTLASGSDITIEERDPLEVSTLGDRRVTAEHAAVGNAAFDVTPAELITAFITDQGMVLPPYHFE